MDTAGYHMVHSVVCMNPKAEKSYLVANIKSTVDNTSKLWIVNKPSRPFWITRKPLRTHKDKKLCVHERELEMHVCAEHELPQQIYEALGYKPKKYVSRNEAFNNPYVYGADIGVSVIYKKKLKDACPDKSVKYSIGTLDIETSVLGGSEVILIAYIDPSGQIYQGIFKPFMGEHTVDEIRTLFNDKLKSFREQLIPKAQAVLDKVTWNLNFYESSSEIDVIKWIFSKIHFHKPDFISVWNNAYDTPYLLDRIQFHRHDPAKIMCHPEVPEEYRVCNYAVDSKKNLEHMTDRWDWFELSGYTQFIDAMCLYSRLRKVIGREISYSLQYIASKVIGTGKLEFGETDTHATMQKDKFIDYAVYNIFDGIILYVLDGVTNDIGTMMSLIDISDIKDFNKQTVQLKNKFYDYCRGLHMVVGSTMGDIRRETDDEIVNIGGGVLSPLLVRNTGIPILQEIDTETRLHRLVADLDATAVWPIVL